MKLIFFTTLTLLMVGCASSEKHFYSVRYGTSNIPVSGYRAFLSSEEFSSLQKAIVADSFMKKRPLSVKVISDNEVEVRFAHQIHENMWTDEPFVKNGGLWQPKQTKYAPAVGMF